MRAIIQAAAMLASTASVAFAQTDVTPPAEPDILVTAPSAKIVRSDVAKMTSASGGQLPRWNGYLCVTTSGLARAPENEVLRALKDAGAEVRLPVLTSGCSTNLWIIASADASATARELLKAFPSMMRDEARFGMASAADRAAFLTPAPVRWMTETRSQTIGAVPSRITVSARENKTSMIVLIDLTAFRRLTWRQLADHIAMIVLTSPSPGVALKSLSIMNLFAPGRGKVPQLTDFDRTLLKGLYISHEQVASARQRDEVARYILKSGVR